MSMYELDDGLVQRFIKDASNMDWMPAAELAVELERQMPIPLPARKLALIEDENMMEFCLLHPEDGTPWFGPTNHQSNLGSWRTPEQMPKDFTVLFEGVEL